MIVDVKDISIRYIVGDFRDIGLKDFVVRKLKRDFKVEEFWAVNHVSFSLEEGDFLGIIGTNGAGKSTLLKTISGIMRPSKGTYRMDGKISALLELGTGFDPDLTLRENIFLRGALLGYTKPFMIEKCEEILDFAELKEYEMRKYKQLSSGMKSRLAFSIACFVNPDILILDEVLSVGDGAFRAKSEKKMFEIIKGGATTLFVSHSTPQVRRLCNKVLWLHKGEQIAFGPTSVILPLYEKFLKDAILPEKEAIEELIAKAAAAPAAPAAPAKPAAPAAPAAPAPKKEEPKKETPAPKKEEPKKETPAPKKEEPKKETPAPKKEEPKKETPAPKKEEPKKETPAPKKEEPKKETPASKKEAVKSSEKTEKK